MNYLDSMEHKEDLQDASNLNVFIPKITGLSGKMTGENTEANHVLQDVKRNLKIEVIGSAYDDVNNHIRQ